MRFLAATLFATALLASTACSDDPSAADDDTSDDDSDDDESSSSGSSSGKGGSSSGKPSSSSGSSSGKPSSSSGGSSGSSGGSSGSSGASSSSGSSGASSSSSGSSGTPWPGPSGTAIQASAGPVVVDLEENEISAHLVASGADDGSFALLFLAYPGNFDDAGLSVIEKHAADGTLTWSKTVEFAPTSPFTGLAMDADGNVYAAVNASPLAGVTVDAVNIPNVRAAEPTTEVGECVLLRLAAADGTKAWHGHVTLKSALTIAGTADVQCRGLAVRDDQLVVSGVYPTKDIFYVQGGVTTSAVGIQSNTEGDQRTSFAISVAAATGVKNSVSALVYEGGPGEYSTDGTAIATDGKTLLNGYGIGTAVKVGSAGSGDLRYQASALAQRDELYFPTAFLNLTGAAATGNVEAHETLATTIEPYPTYPQVVALPNAAGLFAVALTSFSSTTFKPANAGASVALTAGHAYEVFTQMASGSAAGSVRTLDFGATEEPQQHYLAAGNDGSVVLVGQHDATVAFGAGCDTAALGNSGSYLVSFGTEPMAGCKFAVALPAGVLPSRVAVGADGRIFVTGLYTQAATFRAGVTLPAPAGGIRPFFASFVP